jgi:hypothetical protein
MFPVAKLVCVFFAAHVKKNEVNFKRQDNDCTTNDHSKHI